MNRQIIDALLHHPGIGPLHEGRVTFDEDFHGTTPGKRYAFRADCQNCLDEAWERQVLAGCKVTLSGDQGRVRPGDALLLQATLRQTWNELGYPRRR